MNPNQESGKCFMSEHKPNDPKSRLTYSDREKANVL